MKIETITYKRVKNLGNYQTETMEATATVEQSDQPEQVALSWPLSALNFIQLSQ
ncbi:hypothetical protein [Dendronalium sp. ChiSLP03b]|uniref:hypothetical protein n=1 Tax=Dendronalium sp. ChiSLP03b TaxID=3075381 RepID=UPI0026B146FE|nr:hypothetical protein [Dendronalium sp. ChiSLP03b]MDZ8202829.1 hypothetical protein [Dendronalium sp. ChiSLP03b]